MVSSDLKETSMNRRTFLRTATSLSAGAAATRVLGVVPAAHAQQKEFSPRPGTWRTFEMTTRVEILEPAGVMRAWLPIPSVKADYQKPLGDQWSGNAKVMKAVTDNVYGASMLYAEFAAGEAAPVVELTSRFQTQDRAIDWSKKVTVDEAPTTLKMWTRSTDLMPTDGIVHETALQATKGKTTDVEKVKAVYDWILANTYREPKVRGCGVGDIKTMLETEELRGQVRRYQWLFVGLVRSIGMPARDIYGIRVAPSAFGYKSLGAGSANISKAQHCRAEVFLNDHGWVAMDPADVTKVAREETSESLKVDHPLVEAVRPKLFGGWEGNWVALQHRARRRAAERDAGREARLLHVPASRDGAGSTRQPRSRTLSSTRSPRAKSS